MPKIEIIRKGARHPVKITERIAHKLVQSGGFSYVDEADKVSRPKRAVKKDNAARRHEAEPVILNKTTGEEAGPQIHPQPEAVKEYPPDHPPTGVASEPVASPDDVAKAAALERLKGVTMSAGKPMTSARFAVKPTRAAPAPRTPSLTREQLADMTKADLKVLGQKIGVDLKPAEPKDVWVNKLNRYMRRDMRAAR